METTKCKKIKLTILYLNEEASRITIDPICTNKRNCINKKNYFLKVLDHMSLDFITKDKQLKPFI